MALVKASVAAAGGNPSGRASKYKFPAGTPQGDAERREADAERKKREREERARLAEPPPLPSAAGAGGPPALDPNTTASGPVDAQDAAQSNEAVVPWTPDLIQGVVDELLEAAEEGRVASYVARCTEAGLMPKLIREIERDAHFPKTAKVMLKEALPRLTAKWLNKAGISSEYRDELMCVTSLLLIVKHQRKMSSRFDELILEVKKANEARKPGAGIV